METYQELTNSFNQNRYRHCFIIGQTQTGKSNAMNGWALDDINNDRGLLYIDVLGEDIDTLLSHIPKRRIRDTILVDLSDTEHPIAINPLYGHAGDFRLTIADLFVDTLSDLWGYSNMATPDMDRIISNTVTALMGYRDGTLVTMYLFLTSPTFRQRVVKAIADPVVRSFWENFEALDDKDKYAVTKSTVNKLERFVADPRIRNVFGQTASAFDLKLAMGGRKIILVKVPQAEYGRSKARLVASLLLAQVFGITQQRQGLLPFHIYLPHCQEFAPNLVSQMLSSVGKKSVSLTLSCQYLDQLDDGLRTAILGNVGNLVIFRVGLTDASELENLFEWNNTLFGLYELAPFEARSLRPIEGGGECGFPLLTNQPDSRIHRAIVKHSRQQYASQRRDVEEKLDHFLRGCDES